ncbi:signal recognition particle-docking protein FtsY [Wukongibacter sp. M2B1]|uniref:signal recognition particle-docking protein FtsY n=1 Tax=Wukongibacter sp. M2B1 TaxID=3088895 RepID=UPI003D790AD5
MTEKIDTLMKSYTKIDEEFLEELEEILIVSDVGMDTTMKIMDRLRDEIKARKLTETDEVKSVLKEIMEELLTTTKDSSLNISPSPAIVIVIGVNGVGKTTSIGKIGYNIKSKGKKVMLAAGDTFRAAAIDQLKVWGDRVGVNVIHQQEGSDPAAIIYDAIQSAKARKIDVLICDTAGRLHNKKNLMNELGKVFKIVEREYPEAKKEVLLVLDATTGQNAIQQAKTFREVAGITGIVLTKLDGTAKGGVVMGITSELDIPVKYIGVGEGMEDLQPFNAKDFVDALLSEN